MSLFEEWKDLIENQTEESFPEFWKEYSEAETKIYSDILDRPSEKITEIAKKYKQSKTVRRAAPKVGRNDPCPCGSGKKYKHCCGRN